ncbi:hypothetical protein [Peptostreptococcus porci]|uniref:hypothetical protein n=1 Tax=Peptostreptococcus porci TaxID=2652282 RepID=UPI003AB96FD8
MLKRNGVYGLAEVYVRCCKKGYTRSFSSMCSIVDEGFDVDKIVQTQMMIEAVREALSKLNDEEREIIDRLYFNDETIRSVAETKKISHPALIKRRNKILDKLRELLKDFR